MAMCKFPQNGRGMVCWPCWAGAASMTDYAMGPSVVPASPRHVALRQSTSSTNILLSSSMQEETQNNNPQAPHFKEGPTSMLVTVNGGSCLDDGAAVMDDDDEDIICTQNQEMQALTEGTFCKQSSQEPKIEELEEPEEMEEDKLLLHLVQPTSVGGLPHDSSNLNNVTGKRVQRKEARQSDTRRRRWAQADPLLEIWKAVSASKHAAPFRRPVASLGDYDAIVYQRMDLSTIRRHLENELTYSINDLHRDLILTVTNALVYNKKGSDVYNMALKLRAHITKLFEKEASTTKQKQRVSSAVLDQSGPAINKARPKLQLQSLPLVQVGSSARKEQTTNDRGSCEHLLSDNTGVGDLPLAPFKKHRTLWSLQPCISSGSVELACGADAISGAAMDGSSEEEVAAMLICISSGHGFSCGSNQQTVAVKCETENRHGGSCYPEKGSNCNLLDGRFSDSSSLLARLDGVELSPLQDQDPSGSLSSGQCMDVEMGLYKRKWKEDTSGGYNLTCLNALVGDTKEELEAELSGSTSLLAQVDAADILVTSFSSTAIGHGHTGFFPRADNSRCSTMVQNGTLLCSEINQPPSTEGTNSEHKGDHGHDCSHDNKFAIGDRGSQRMCMGLKHKWQQQWRMQSTANYESELHLLDNLTSN
ncbi:unnamed protein product [Sphagnum troendelagicum]|uniref:Bromo domain-containing protein n=1 Tax=Sphagnum troendelagicum TaxID=128251 RepID=A0ABP0TSZ1_9BRYO